MSESTEELRRIIRDLIHVAENPGTYARSIHLHTVEARKAIGLPPAERPEWDR